MGLLLISFSSHSQAGVYKCIDGGGKTSYQAKPCADEKTSIEVNVKTGGLTDLGAKLEKQEKEGELKKQQVVEQQEEAEEKIAKDERRKKDAIEQSAINQQLVKDNPVQFSAFAIPPYRYGKLPSLVQSLETRLPEIERFRRVAAQKALETGQCGRVESDELSIKSKIDRLVFSVDCSSAKNFQFNESELGSGN